ncbi:MAG: DUF1292 domain-containing protein [Bacillaceae bacterium]|nr:DUF1292 domain-containing protein [Bacillaceae bacterium]
MLDGIEVGETITLTEEGNEEFEKDFTIMYAFDIEDQTYLCLVPVEQQTEEEYDVYFLRYNGTDTLEPIEDEQEWENVQQTFETLVHEAETDDQQG